MYFKNFALSSSTFILIKNSNSLKNILSITCFSLLLFSAKINYVLCEPAPKKDQTQADEHTKKMISFDKKQIELNQKFIERRKKAVSTFNLKNGIKVIKNQIDSQISYIKFAIRWDSADVLRSQRPHATLIASMLSKGNKTYKKQEFINLMDKYSFDIYCEPEVSCSPSDSSFSCSLTADNKHLDLGMDLLSSMIKQPLFSEDEFILVKQKALKSVKMSCSGQKILGRANNLLNTIFYNIEHPFYYPMQHQLDEIEKTTTKDLKQIYKMFLNGARSFIVASSSIKDKKLDKIFNKAFGSIDSWYFKDKQISPPTANKMDLTIQYTDKSGKDKKDDTSSSTVAIRLKSVVPGVKDPNTVGLEVLGLVLAHLINEKIRETSGLSYIAHAGYASFDFGLYHVFLTTGHPQKALTLLKEVFDYLKTQEIDEEKFIKIASPKFTQTYWQFSSPLRTNDLFAESYLYFMQPFFYLDYTNEILMLTPKKILEIAQKHLKKYKMALLGPKKTIGKSKFYKDFIKDFNK